MKTVLYELKEIRSLAEVSAYLHDLARQLDAGQILLPKVSEYPELVVPEELLLEVKTEEKVKGESRRFSFEVELKWEGEPLPKQAEKPAEAEEEITQAKAEAMLG